MEDKDVAFQSQFFVSKVVTTVQHENVERNLETTSG